MSQYSMGPTSSFDRNGHWEEAEYFYGQSEEQEERKEEKEKKKGHHSKQDTWKGVFIVTQFWVICFAAFAFLVVVYAGATKLSDRLTLETKDRVSQSQTWFKLAICLRPFMTADGMKEMYKLRLNRSFIHHIDSLDISDEEKGYFRRSFYFDNTLNPQLYQYYFRHVHPWKDISPNVLWDFQNNTIRTAFEEFRVNGISAGTTQREETLEDIPKGDRGSLGKYTTLPSQGTWNATENKPILLGEYFLSPMYLGCLGMTVTQEMADKQMEIKVKFRPKKNVLIREHGAANKTVSVKTILLFEAADIFMFDKDDTFTEIPTIKKHAKFSIMATSRERLLVTNSLYIRQRSSRRNCEMAEIDSETLCRRDCEFKGLLDEINCTLPWMERFRQYPNLVEKYESLPVCGDLDVDSFLETVQIQDEFLFNIKITEKKQVQKCLQGCTESCKSSQVRILSLGSKSIGSNYGVTLTVSPAIDMVKEHFSYNVANMVSELCASVSFLLGLSAIAIYDWFVAFGVWASAKLGLHVPEEEEGEGGSPPPAERGSSPPPAHLPSRSGPAPSLHPTRDPTGPTGDPTDSGPSQSGGPAEGRKRRVSLLLPDDELSPHPVV